MLPKLNPFAAIANGAGDEGGAFAKLHPFHALADKEFSGSSFWGSSRGNGAHPAPPNGRSWSNSRGRGDVFLKSNGSAHSGFGKLNTLTMAFSARSSDSRDSVPLLSRRSEGNKKAS